MSRSRSYTDEQLIEAVANNRSWRQVLFSLGLREGGGAHANVKKVAKQLNLSTEHITGHPISNNPSKIPLDEILEGKHPQYQTSKLKKRLIKEGILENKCSSCGITEWNGKSIVIQLDHVNGNSKDHTLGNLRMLCPNCHSQTDTFAGKNKNS